jgi:phospholipase/lecithinase/hemolysin
MRAEPSRRISRIVLAIAMCLVLVSTAGAAETFDRMVIFGDSLTDPGNHFVAFGITSQPPYAPLPDFPYAIGGHHFSNGPTWAEQLTRALGMPTSGKPALHAPGVFTNYAVGRARARAEAPAFPQFDLSAQVQQFLADFAGHAPSNALYVIWIGANDFDDALVAAQSGDPDAAKAIINGALAAIAHNVTALWAAGARNFMIPNLPNPALTPFVRAFGPDAAAAATAAGEMYNLALDWLVMQLGEFPGVHVMSFDVKSVFTEIVATHGDGELGNVTEPCVAFGMTVHAVCKHPNDYLFWDAAHPTKAGHRLIAEAVLRLVETAPGSQADDDENERR